MVLLVSTYDLGRQPFGLASPAAWLRNAGLDVACLDLSRQVFDADLARADLVAFHLPMHTATRLALPVIDRVRRLNPQAKICCYGLYAPLNETLLRARGARYILGAEYEQQLTDVAKSPPAAGVATVAGEDIPRLSFVVPGQFCQAHIPAR